MGNTTPAKKSLSVVDAVAIIVGLVIGAGIFKTPAQVAASSGSAPLALLLWLGGGFVSLVGALCYAELASAYPHAGGDYHYLTRAYGAAPGFLFAWARMTVIQAGSIAMLAFLIGDYASGVLRLGPFSSSVYAALAVALLTAVNVAGIRQGSGTQKALTAAILAGLFIMTAAGLSRDGAPVPAAPAPPGGGAAGKALIFVLLTYGGWNEAAYLSSELGDPGRNMLRVLVYSVGVVTAVYVAVNFALLHALGLAAVAGSETVAADMMGRAMGTGGASFISLLVALAALSTMNGSIITGARTNYALGRDWQLFGFLGRWEEGKGTPANALLLQGAVALLLVGVATGARGGFTQMVEYTAPVFWLFFLLTGVALIVLRRKDPRAARPFRVPLYPLTPLVFCATCAYMLVSSLAFTGKGALAGVLVLLTGIPVLLFELRAARKRSPVKEKGTA